jgi:hypothetical protein
LSGALRVRIHRYKYEAKTGWSMIFGRLVVGWLEAHAAGDPPGLIVANPTFAGGGDPREGHTERIIRSAAIEDAEGLWRFDTAHSVPVIVKTGPTGKSAGQAAPAKRASAAELRRLLTIPDPSVTDGRKILVLDDVCTTGSQLDAIAGFLLEEGNASEVRGLVLARAPWRRP